MCFTSVCIFHILSEKWLKKERKISFAITNTINIHNKILNRIFDLANNNDNNDQKKLRNKTRKYDGCEQ